MPANWKKNVSLALCSFIVRPTRVGRINILPAKGTKQAGFALTRAMTQMNQGLAWEKQLWRGKGKQDGNGTMWQGGEQLKNRRTEAIATRGICTSGLFGLCTESS